MLKKYFPILVLIKASNVFYFLFKGFVKKADTKSLKENLKMSSFTYNLNNLAFCRLWAFTEVYESS